MVVVLLLWTASPTCVPDAADGNGAIEGGGAADALMVSMGEETAGGVTEEDDSAPCVGALFPTSPPPLLLPVAPSFAAFCFR